jgi:hypothetical protein
MVEKPQVQLYSVFHLNSSFSSIEEAGLPAVVERCYWPLLHLVEQGYPLGIEATGLTLRKIFEIDPDWVATLRRLLHEGACEFVGSGYVQLIGPLVPVQVNRKNLELGQQTYDELLGVRPKLALLNEMAYSSSLVSLYLDAGYDAILMDWSNPYSLNQKDWNLEWMHYPQRAIDEHGNSIPLVWLDTISFQKFQRYVYGELDAHDIIDLAEGAGAQHTVAYPLYGSDAEIFDHRPGRFLAEPDMGVESEWARIEHLLDVMKNHGKFRFIQPHQVLDLLAAPGANHALSLGNAIEPIPVKKQRKYNILRWSASGRDDVLANTACWRVYERMIKNAETSDARWRELCRLWSSDFRTHITEKRWIDFQEDLRRAGAFDDKTSVFDEAQCDKRHSKPQTACVLDIKVGHRMTTAVTPWGRVMLRNLRGLAIEGIWRNESDQSFCRTLPQGYFCDINWGADFYSGHLVIQPVGEPQETDLTTVKPTVFYAPDHSYADLEVDMRLRHGPVFKRVRIFAHLPKVEVSYRIPWLDRIQGPIRFGNVTLNPAGFERKSLYYAVHNGGANWEHYPLGQYDVDHTRSHSFATSSSSGVGMTEGQIIIGDRCRSLLIDCPRSIAALPAMVTCNTVPVRKGPSFFCRVALPYREVDDTLRRATRLDLPRHDEISYSITAINDAD